MNIPNKTILIDCVLCTLWRRESFYDVPFKVMMDDKKTKLHCWVLFGIQQFIYLLLGTEVEEITH